MRNIRPLRVSLLILGALGVVAVLGLLAPRLLAQEKPEPLNAKEALKLLAAKEDPDGTAARLRATYRPQALKNGAPGRLEETTVLWALEVPKGPVYVVSEGKKKQKKRRLRRVGKSGLYAGAFKLKNFQEFEYQYEVNQKLIGNKRRLRLEYFPTPPEALEQEGVPQGKITQHRHVSKVFPGAERDYWVYVPAQYQPGQPANVMVFQDGQGYLRGSKVPTVFDNLIHQGEMPVTVGIFINPGVFPREGQQPRRNRSFEYDTLSDQYARFLRDEILPEVGKMVELKQDAASRAICGISSGGICAWTAAWEMPDMWSKVISHVGSFTNIASGASRQAGGHNYPALIRKTDKKPIRIWMQDGSNDLDNRHGSWPLANQQLAAALKFSGYDYQFVYGEGFHSMRHGASTLPDALCWIWRDYPGVKPPK